MPRINFTYYPSNAGALKRAVLALSNHTGGNYQGLSVAKIATIALCEWLQAELESTRTNPSFVPGNGETREAKEAISFSYNAEKDCDIDAMIERLKQDKAFYRPRSKAQICVIAVKEWLDQQNAPR